jgi:hypothetical protein
MGKQKLREREGSRGGRGPSKLSVNKPRPYENEEIILREMRWRACDENSRRVR